METQSPDISQLMAQLLLMHNKYGVIISKDAKNHKNKYASLPQVLDVIHEWTAAFQMRLTQASRLVDGHNVMETTLYHITSKQFIKCHSYLTVAEGGNPDQAWGGSTTYHRRYDAMALLGLFADEDPADNDGNNGSNSNAHGTPKPNFVPAAPGVPGRQYTNSKPISEKQLGLLKMKFKNNIELLQEVLEECEVETLDEMTMDHAKIAFDRLAGV